MNETIGRRCQYRHKALCVVVQNVNTYLTHSGWDQILFGSLGMPRGLLASSKIFEAKHAVRMLVLVGKPFKTDVSNLQMLDPSHFTQTLEQERKYYRDAKETSAHELQTTEASTGGARSQQRRGRSGSPGRVIKASGVVMDEATDNLLVVDHQLPGVTEPRLTVNAHPTVPTARAMVHKALHEVDKEDFPLADIPLAVVDKEDLLSVEAVETNLTVKDHHKEDIPPDGGGGVRRY
ncbi:hypothetical protein F5887DRAFT_926168 [Amanita rubescens]|nr:hypothetical protein F5887DRAFT_926168 [Amanita rubescens]